LSRGEARRYKRTQPQHARHTPLGRQRTRRTFAAFPLLVDAPDAAAPAPAFVFAAAVDDVDVAAGGAAAADTDGLLLLCLLLPRAPGRRVIDSKHSNEIGSRLT
jgi:hypothetical protein